MYRKKVLSNAVALSLGLSAAGMAGVAHSQADLLFPYVVSGDNVTTVLSVVNRNQFAPTRWELSRFTDFDLTREPVYRLNIALNYKMGAGFNNADFCNHYDGPFVTSVNDLTSFDVSGLFGVGALFNDTMGAESGGDLDDAGFLQDIADFASFRGYVSIWDIWSRPRFDATLDDDGNPIGFLGFNPTFTSPSAARTLEGDALVIDFNSGSAWGYRGLSRGWFDNTWFANLSNATYDVYPTNFDAFGRGLRVPFMPLADVQTRFFITTLNDNRILQRDGTPGTVRARLGGGSGNTLFNRLEQARSLNASIDINCLGVVDIEDFLAGAATSPFVAQGGFSALNINDVDAGGRGLIDGKLAHVMKLEFGKTNTLNGVSTGGTYNNAYSLNYSTDLIDQAVRVLASTLPDNNQAVIDAIALARSLGLINSDRASALNALRELTTEQRVKIQEPAS